jgi:uncharacterized protein YbjT (DUF2867 family)
VISESGVPWTTLRAAQFHDLVLTAIRKMSVLPVLPIPKVIQFQPVDSREVADRLVELTLGTASGHGARHRGAENLPAGRSGSQLSAGQW